jgi:hypothetical protein
LIASLMFAQFFNKDIVRWLWKKCRRFCRRRRGVMGCAIMKKCFVPI